MTSLTQSDGPLGLSACGQRLSYIIIIIFCLLAVVARFWSYKGDSKYMSEIPRLRWMGDVSVVFSFIIFFTVIVMQFKLLDMTADKVHSGNTPDDSVEAHIYVLKSLYASRVLYSVFIYVMKVGFISHYIALSYVASQRLQMLLWATVAMSIIGFLGTVGATAFFCVPVDRVWAPGETDSCNAFSDLQTMIPFTYMNVTLDLMILAYPIIAILGMHLPPRRKLFYLAMVITTGIWPAMAATYRFYLVVQYLDVQDIVHTSPQSTVALASMFEMASLLVSVSFPAYRVLRRKLWASPGFQRGVLNPIRKYVMAPIKKAFLPAAPAQTPERADTWETVYRPQSSHSSLKTVAVARMQHPRVAVVKGDAGNRDSQNSQNPFRDMNSSDDVGDSSWSEEADMERAVRARAGRHSFESICNVPTPSLQNSRTV